MAKKSSPSKSWSNPKDFGLPYVDLEPLKKYKAATKPEKVAKVDPPKKEEEKVEAPVLEAKKQDFLPKEKAAKQQVKEELKENKLVTPSQEKRKVEEKPSGGKTWVYWAAGIGIALVSFIIWQMNPNGPQESSTTQEMLTESAPPPKQTEAVDQAEKEEENEAVILDSAKVPEVEEPAPPTVSQEEEQKTESGTTIETRNPGELIRVETKPVPSQYFIIVGSLPNERLALREAEKYWDRASEMYLLSPNEDSDNYRLAIGKFSGFTPANAELQRVKNEYKEALWILKY